MCKLPHIYIHTYRHIHDSTGLNILIGWYPPWPLEALASPDHDLFRFTVPGHSVTLPLLVGCGRWCGGWVTRVERKYQLIACNVNGFVILLFSTERYWFKCTSCYKHNCHF